MASDNTVKALISYKYFYNENKTLRQQLNPAIDVFDLLHSLSISNKRISTIIGEKQ